MTSLTRRGLLAASAATTTSAPVAAWTTAPMAASTFWTPDATAVAAMIRNREISVIEAVEVAIRRTEALQPSLNFLACPDFDRALDAAKRGGQTGPFAGVPFLVKDLDDYVGLPTRFGTAAARQAPAAQTQGAWVDAMARTGFVTIGKSTTPEFGFLPTTEPLAYGPTRNPWNTGRSSGGSSGGAAVAVAAGVVPIAHASDGGGSIRMPASNCGLFGFKPSRGRLAGNTGRKVFNLTVDHCVTHSVRDSAALFAATEQSGRGALYRPVGLVSEPLGRKLRVGVVARSVSGAAPDPEVKAAVDGAVALIESLGHDVSETAWPVDEGFTQDFLVLWASGAYQSVAATARALGRRPERSLFEPFTLSLVELVVKSPKDTYPNAIRRLNQAMAAYDAWLQRFDLILSPVLGSPPPPLGYVAGDVPFDTLIERLTPFVGYTPLHNVVGAPAMSVPLHWTADELPVGVQFAARAGGEGLLFQLAYQLEAARPWSHRRPPVFAT